MFDDEWLSEFARRWNADFRVHHPRFEGVGAVAMIGHAPGETDLACLLRWNDRGCLAEAFRTSPESIEPAVPRFAALRATWQQYTAGERSAAYYFATGAMTFRGDPLFLLTKGLLFDIVARCASLQPWPPPSREHSINA